MHWSVILSRSVRGGWSLDRAATLIVHWPAFVPCLFVGTLMPVKAPPHEAAEGESWSRPIPRQRPFALSFFLNVAAGQPGWSRQRRRLKVQTLLTAVAQSVPRSGTGPVACSCISTRHSLSCASARGAPPRTLATSTAAAPMT